MHSLNTFIGQSFKNFMKTGAIFPSSTNLAKRMTKNMKGPIILELGSGTGIFTKEILTKLPIDGLLISIDSNRVFIDHLDNKIKDSRLKLCFGDALMLGKFLKENGVDKIDCVISGLPIGHFRKELKNKILTEIYEYLNPGGIFIQFQYFLTGIVAIKNVFPDVSISFEPMNIPPAFVIRCKK